MLLLRAELAKCGPFWNDGPHHLQNVYYPAWDWCNSMMPNPRSEKLPWGDGWACACQSWGQLTSWFCDQTREALAEDGYVLLTYRVEDRADYSAHGEHQSVFRPKHAVLTDCGDLRTGKPFAKIGEDGKGWYHTTAELLRRVYGEDYELMAVILAATSINTTVKANLTLALKAYAQFKDGRAFEGFIPAAAEQLDHIRNGRPLTGPKIEAFRRALLGDDDAVVVDRWMLRAYGEPNLTLSARERVTKAVEAGAQHHGMKPAEYQAAVWTGIKRSFERHDTDVSSFTNLLSMKLSQTELPL